ncbi:hypothetical protein K438DRAFT_1772254 [Mycena galopus ATCC 62051]|nr:hypothetical protein K438DRAFT_1772254 [Mycena galopus ATCC 62051]
MASPHQPGNWIPNKNLLPTSEEIETLELGSDGRERLERLEREIRELEFQEQEHTKRNRLEREAAELERHEQERQKMQLLRRMQLIQLLKVPPEGLLLMALSSFVFIMLAVRVLELIEWLLFRAFLIPIRESSSPKYMRTNHCPIPQLPICL